MGSGVDLSSRDRASLYRCIVSRSNQCIDVFICRVKRKAKEKEVSTLQPSRLELVTSSNQIRLTLRPPRLLAFGFMLQSVEITH